jgi:hypothetical protein
MFGIYVTNLDQMMEQFRKQDSDWKNDYAVVRAAYMVAKLNRNQSISGSPEWETWNRIESVAFDVMGVILDGRP